MRLFAPLTLDVPEYGRLSLPGEPGRGAKGWKDCPGREDDVESGEKGAEGFVLPVADAAPDGGLGAPSG